MYYKIIIAFLTLIYIIFSCMYIIYLERKIAGIIQDRYGPMEVGVYGLLQPVADVIKLIQKQNIKPIISDKILFNIAPIIVFLSVFMCFAEIPFIYSNYNLYSNFGIILIFLMLNIKVFGLLIAGLSSNNGFSIIGSVRLILQFISYELPLILSIIAMAITLKTLNLQLICIKQGLYCKNINSLNELSCITNLYGIFQWNIIQYPHFIIIFIIFFISSLALCNRIPFDIYESESELVAGIYVEYSGLKWGILFLSEYSLMLLSSILMVIFFFGGWNISLYSTNISHWSNNYICNFLCINIKTIILIIVKIWIRWTVLRLRIDQTMYFFWTIMIPLSLICIIISLLYIN